jgi:hypothetical protein
MCPPLDIGPQEREEDHQIKKFKRGRRVTRYIGPQEGEEDHQIYRTSRGGGGPPDI